MLHSHQNTQCHVNRQLLNYTKWVSEQYLVPPMWTSPEFTSCKLNNCLEHLTINSDTYEQGSKNHVSIEELIHLELHKKAVKY